MLKECGPREIAQALENKSMRVIGAFLLCLSLILLPSKLKADEFFPVVRTQCIPEIELFSFEVFGLWNAGLYPNSDFTDQVARERDIYLWRLAAAETFECQFRDTEISTILHCPAKQGESRTQIQSPNCQVDSAFVRIAVNGKVVIDQKLYFEVSDDFTRGWYSFPTHRIVVGYHTATHCYFQSPVNVIGEDNGQYLPNEGRCMTRDTKR